MTTKTNSRSLLILVGAIATLLVFAFILVAHHRDVPVRVEQHLGPSGNGK